jgi:YVTN family beta-propeller protein
MNIIVNERSRAKTSYWRYLPLLLLLTVVTTSLRAQTVTTTITVGSGVIPAAVAVNPVTNKIYVVINPNTFNLGQGSVTVVDGATNTTSTVSAGIGSVAIAINPVTNKIYVANTVSNDVTVIDGATNTTSTVGVGSNPNAVAVNPVTNKIYVANTVSNDVTVIDGATNTTGTVGVGSNPNGVAVNPVTNKIYVTNGGSGNVTVVDGATNTPTTVGAGTDPDAVAVNPVTNQIYVTNGGSGNVTVIDGATNTPSTVGAGTNPNAVAVNPVTNKIYVTNGGSSNVTVIDGATNAPLTVTMGANPVAVAVNPVTNQIYVGFVPNPSGTLTVIDGATNNAVSIARANGSVLALNPVTNKIYVTGFGVSGNGLTVVDGATNTATTVAPKTSPFAVAVNPVTNKIYVVNPSKNNMTVIDGATNATTTIPAGTSPFVLAVNPVTNKIYVVSNSESSSVTVIDGATNNIEATIPTGVDSSELAVNTVTNQIYVVNSGNINNGQPNNGSVTVIDGATNTTTTLAIANPSGVGVNPVTNQIYTTNNHGLVGQGTVVVIDGATNNTVELPVGTVNGGAVIVNPVTNMIYVSGGDGIVIIDGATNDTQTAGIARVELSTINPITNKLYAIDGSNNPGVVVIDGNNPEVPVGVRVGSVPVALAVDPVTNRIYVANHGSGDVTVIDGATNTVTATVTAGADPQNLALNPVTNTVYVVDEGTCCSFTDGSVTVISEQNTQVEPLTTTIAPLPDNQTFDPHPTFNFTTSSSFNPFAPTPEAVYFQVDTWQGPWLAASGISPNFSGTTPYVLPGTHVLYAYATDGQGGTSGFLNSNFVGSMAAYVFTALPTAFNFTLAATPASATVLPGNSVNYAVTVSSITGGDNLNLTVSGLPAGASASFGLNPAVVPPGSSRSSDMFVTTDSSTPAGAYPLTITATGVSTGVSHSTAVTLFVQETTTTALSSSLNPSFDGQAVTFTATVSATTGGTPIGFMYFRDSGALLARVPLSGGVATFTTSALVGGTHSLDAHYGGNLRFPTSTSAVLTQTVNGQASGTRLTFDPPTPTFGQPVTITANVSGSGLTPTGTVIFKDRTRTLGTVVLDGTGNAHITTSATGLEGGPHIMTAIYSGDLVYNNSSAGVALTVNPAASTTALSLSQNPFFGETRTILTATVNGPGTPLGFIYFRDSGALLARVPLTGGVARFAILGFAGTTHLFDAHYGGNLSWDTSTSPVLTEVFNGTPTTTALTFNPAAPTFGQAVTMTATVSVSVPNALAFGTVTFNDGTTTLGTVSLRRIGTDPFTTAQFTTSTTALASGSHTISAIYSGDTANDPSSVSVPLTVSPAATTTTLSSSPNPSTSGASVTFTARVTGFGRPIGSIDFRDGGIVLATVPLSTTCCGSLATFTTNTLAHGSHSIDAHYGGNVNWQTSTSAVLTQTVN